jgi:hypothetical protein
MLGDMVGIGGGLISTKLDEVKEIQNEIEDKLELWSHAAFRISMDGMSGYVDENSRRQYEMFDDLYRLVCAVGGLQKLKETDKEARK